MTRVHIATLEDGMEIYAYVETWLYKKMEIDATIEEIEQYLANNKEKDNE